MFRLNCILSSLLLTLSTAGAVHAQSGRTPDSVDQRSGFGSPAIMFIDPYSFDDRELDSIRYSRVELPEAPDRQTEFSLRVHPGRFEFSRNGGYGLGLITGSRLALESREHDRLLEVDVPQINHGLAYSAGVRFEHENERIDGTAYVSSSLLGLSYGRLGRLWYGGIDVNLEYFDDERHGAEQPDVLSLDFTTGRRLGLTGLDAGSPLWMLSLQGNFDVHDVDAMPEQEDTLGPGAWYLNPSLFWERPSFTFSAQMQLPVEFDSAAEALDEPDYGLRAVFEKRF
ncbi:MAG: hypothetical protein CSB44_07915 [Gammaproteobacteria bacterium]|nr:MAG: hypothetical protein CSB44_07915 [Gammaproteobacteria bacterium]